MPSTTVGAKARVFPPGLAGGVSTAERFREAVKAGDHETLRGLLAKDVKLFGPVMAEPVHGIRDAGAVLWAALSRFDSIHYFGQASGWTVHGNGGATVETHMLRFHAMVSGEQIEGIDVIELNGDGLICALTVLFRPLASVIRTTFVARHHRTREGYSVDRGNAAPGDRRIRLALDYLHGNLADKPTLAGMAAAAGLSTSQVAALFRAAVGVSPHRYLMQQRVERARHLLRHTQMTIAEVAARTGFADQSHLTRVMRRAADITPAALRRS